MTPTCGLELSASKPFSLDFPATESCKAEVVSLILNRSGKEAGKFMEEWGDSGPSLKDEGVHW